MEPNDPRLHFMPVTDIEKRSGPCHVIRDSWWAVHPENGLIFYGASSRGIDRASPQCNRDKSSTDMIAGKMYPWAEIKFLPIVICPPREG